VVAQKIKAWCKRAHVAHVAGFEGCAAPENLTGEITRFAPSHVLLVDAARLGLDPGEVRMIGADEVTGTSFSTHMLPAPIVFDYLKQSCGCEALVVGIQPEQTDVMGPISRPVAKAIDAVVATVKAAMKRG
jgi:hydrogenase 3 maturation protease